MKPGNGSSWWHRNSSKPKALRDQLNIDFSTDFSKKLEEAKSVLAHFFPRPLVELSGQYIAENISTKVYEVNRE